ncbi:MAG: PHP domain-containing protein [Thermoplasmata archaeon]|nr:PHP domain-containing protein [Thermoplasmata archaeon]
MGSIRLDLHVHSRHSPDGFASVSEIVDRLGVAGVQGFALTDHNTIAGHAELAELGRRFPMYRLIPGIEVSTLEGHLLLYGVRELPPIHRPLLETLDWARAHAAVPVLSHPLRWSHGVGAKLARVAPVAALETLNGHNGELTNARASVIAAERRLGETGGSDAHTVRTLGRAVTEFPEDTEVLDALLSEIRGGRTRALGRSLSLAERLRLRVATVARRAARGFRAI